MALISKQEQFAAEEQRQFLQQPVALPQRHVHLGPYPPQPAHVMYNGYPQIQPGYIAVHHVVAEDPDDVRRRNLGCCVPCWSIFLAIGGALGIWNSGRMIVACSSVDSCYVSLPSGSLFSLLLQLVLAVFCVYVYYSRRPSPLLLTLNYVAWILLAVASASLAFVAFGAALAVTVFGASISTLFHFGTDMDNVVAIGVTIFSVITWSAASSFIIPLIVNSVLASKNRVPCSCSSAPRSVENVL